MYYKLGQACVTNWDSFVITLLQIGAASSLQIGVSVVTNWSSYYKLGQPLLQNGAAITNLGKIYYKLGQVLQIRAIIRNWGITDDGYILAVSGWWWMVVDIFWLVVGGGEYILVSGG